MAYISFEPKDYVNTKIYTGNGGDQTITGVGFTPDWVWFKSRDAGNSHAVLDIVRGTTKVLYAETTSSEQTINAQTFNSDGYDLVQDAGANSINSSGSAKVAWSWKANGVGATNEDGSINTIKTSANTTSGFSIVKYQGTGSNATVGHGLGVAPRMIIVKSLGTNDWSVYHGSLGGTKAIFMDITSGSATHVDYWNNTNTTSSVFSIGISSNMNHSSTDMIAYCFAEKKGFSKFSSFVGNGNADGTFVYTGFKPTWVLIKRTSASGDQWQLSDSKRGFNGAIKTLYTDSAEVETSSDSIDHLSNGFKNRATSVARNGSGSDYIYMAFAEEPLVSTNGTPATAR